MHLRKSSILVVPLLTGFVVLTPIASWAADSPEAKNMELVGRSDLNGNGDGGEGMAIQQWPDGRRILYIAHEGEKTCLSIVDVTHPEKPVMVNQLPSPQPGVTRCNSLGLSGNVLVVANQAKKVGQTSAGLWVLDVSDFARLQISAEIAGYFVFLLRHFRASFSGRPLRVVRRRAVRASHYRHQGFASD